MSITFWVCNHGFTSTYLLLFCFFHILSPSFLSSLYLYLSLSLIFLPSFCNRLSSPSSVFTHCLSPSLRVCHHGFTSTHLLFFSHFHPLSDPLRRHKPGVTQPWWGQIALTSSSLTLNFLCCFKAAFSLKQWSNWQFLFLTQLAFLQNLSKCNLTYYTTKRKMINVAQYYLDLRGNITCYYASQTKSVRKG